MRRMWGLADYAGLAQRLDPAAELLVDRLPTVPGRVLDLAAGTGNVSARLVERGATVSAADLSPRMVELGRARTGDAVGWHEADAQDLPFAEHAFDAVLSAFGIVFAPRPGDALAQARRVLAPGGLLAFTAWTPSGLMGAMTEVMRRWLPTPDDVADVLDWGREPVVEDWVRAAGFTDVTLTRAVLPWHFDSPAAMTGFLLEHSPTHLTAAGGLGERAGEMFAAVEQIAGSPDRPVRLDAEYLVVAAR